jgi:hypothetical protein
VSAILSRTWNTFERYRSGTVQIEDNTLTDSFSRRNTTQPFMNICLVCHVQDGNFDGVNEQADASGSRLA